MDLENRLLQQLADYQPELGKWARVRQAVRYGVSREAAKLLDEACELHLIKLTEVALPDGSDGQHDEEILNMLPHLSEVNYFLRANGYDRQLETGEGLLPAILGWAAVQGYTSWGTLPWKRVAETILDSRED